MTERQPACATLLVATPAASGTPWAGRASVNAAGRAAELWSRLVFAGLTAGARRFGAARTCLRHANMPARPCGRGLVVVASSSTTSSSSSAGGEQLVDGERWWGTSEVAAGPSLRASRAYAVISRAGRAGGIVARTGYGAVHASGRSGARVRRAQYSVQCHPVHGSMRCVVHGQLRSNASYVPNLTMFIRPNDSARHYPPVRTGLAPARCSVASLHPSFPHERVALCVHACARCRAIGTRNLAGARTRFRFTETSCGAEHGFTETKPGSVTTNTPLSSLRTRLFT